MHEGGWRGRAKCENVAAAAAKCECNPGGLTYASTAVPSWGRTVALVPITTVDGPVANT